MIIERELQPLERFVWLASHGVNLSDLIGQLISAIGNEIGQSRVCGRPIAAHVVGKRQFETAITFIRLQLRFPQRRLTIAALDRDVHLVAMIASSGRLQLCRFPCNGVCLIQFSRDEKNATQITLRCDGKRVEFHRLPGLPLGLINSPQINNHSGQ